MGCAAPKKQRKYIPPPLSTSAGTLNIKVTDGVLFHQASLFTMDPYVKLKLSNQEKTSKVVEKGGKTPNFNETFSFYINSSNKLYGRNLQMTLMDRKKIGGDNLVGYGLVDLNPVIDLKKKKDQFRCMLTYEYKEAGFLNIQAEFIEQQAETVNFRFRQAIIRRETSTFGDMNCWIEITIGQQTMKTKKHKDLRKKPPTWQDEVIPMKILPSITNCQIRVMDDSKEIGNLSISMARINKIESVQNFVEDFIFEDGLYAGTLKFQVTKGVTPTSSTSNQDVGKANSQQNYFGTIMVKPNPAAEETKCQ